MILLATNPHAIHYHQPATPSQFVSVGKVDTIKNCPTKQHYGFLFVTKIDLWYHPHQYMRSVLLFEVICVRRKGESSLAKALVSQTVAKSDGAMKKN